MFSCTAGRVKTRPYDAESGFSVLFYLQWARLLRFPLYVQTFFPKENNNLPKKTGAVCFFVACLA